MKHILTRYKVTGEAQGDSGALAELVNHLNKGPSAARVSKVEVKNIETKEGETGFSR